MHQSDVLFLPIKIHRFRQNVNKMHLVTCLCQSDDVFKDLHFIVSQYFSDCLK